MENNTEVKINTDVKKQTLAELLRNRAVLIYSILLVLVTAYVALDTFIIPHNAQAVNTDTEQNVTVDDSNYISEEIYSDKEMYVRIEHYREYGTDIHLAHIIFSGDKLPQAAFAHNQMGRNINDVALNMAKENGAVIAINGDYYGSRDAGYVIRNGVLYRDVPMDNREDLVIYSDGSFGFVSEKEISAEELLNDGAYQVFSFGPALIKDSKSLFESKEHSLGEFDKWVRSDQKHPRTAVGKMNDNYYIFCVADGRTDENPGINLYELTDFLLSRGVTEAYNLDGGGSATMVFNNTVVNKPSGDGDISEREISDIVYFK